MSENNAFGDEYIQFLKFVVDQLIELQIQEGVLDVTTQQTCESDFGTLSEEA